MLSHRRLLDTAIASLMAIAGAANVATAQGVQTAGTSRTAIVTARLEGRLGEILSIRPIGAPVQMADGTVEQRYAVIANVPFTMTGPAGGASEVIVAERGAGKPSTEYLGAPGFHEDIRVRSRATSAEFVAVTLQRSDRAAPVASGSGN
jgi:hypothetical protein